MAAAATMAGDISSVRPVGEPWRPLKLRLLVEAQSSSPTSLSGVMARHMEQPGGRPPEGGPLALGGRVERRDALADARVLTRVDAPGDGGRDLLAGELDAV